MNMQDILYNRLHGIISFVPNMTDNQVEEAFEIFKELDANNKYAIEEHALYHGSTLYSRIRQWRTETREY